MGRGPGHSEHAGVESSQPGSQHGRDEGLGLHFRCVEEVEGHDLVDVSKRSLSGLKRETAGAWGKVRRPVQRLFQSSRLGGVKGSRSGFV